MRSYLKKSITKKMLVEWLKVKALSSNLSARKKKKKIQADVLDPRHKLLRFHMPGLVTGP
jgi:hypothetical protein